MTDSCCKNPCLVTAYAEEARVNVRICASCGTSLDTQALRDCDLPGLGAESPGGPEPPLKTQGHDRSCSLHGGSLEACTTGYRKANACANSKWGSRRAVNGPCGCLRCHTNPEEFVEN